MSKAQTLETVIALRGRVDNSVAVLGDKLTVIGSQINRISQQVIEFGKDSLDVYKEYEQNMADAEAALRTGTYRSRAGELEGIMDRLNEHAAEWARTTKFHTSDVSGAISKAAHAGWDYLDMIEGIPAAMLLAQGGGMDLEETLDYLVKAMNATKTEFNDADKFIDQWITGANLGATNAQEFGDAMVRMGNTAMFADSTEELFTLLTVLANVGTVGSTAGTMLRNGMIRLVAPTTQARAAMELLGASSEEIEEALSDKTISKAATELHELGFSAFDEAGNLKPMLQVFKELDQVTAGLTEQRRDQLLSAIFPMRSITGALAILEAAKEDYGDLYEMIRDSEGAGQIASDIQMDTLEGRTEIFKSKVEELKRTLGERLAPKAEGIMDTLGGFIDDLSTMDDAKFDGLVSGLTTIAAAGPAMMLLGGAIKLIGSLGWGGVAMAGVAVLMGAAKYVSNLEKTKLNGKFGNMNWDTSAVKKYISEIGKEFDLAVEQIEEYKLGVEEAAETYRTASETLSGDLLTHFLTKTEFTDADKQKAYDLADSMYDALHDAIVERSNQDASLLAWLYEGNENDQNFIDLVDFLYIDYTESENEAREIGEKLRSALTDAFTDGMTDEEYEKIKQYMEEYNEAMAKAAAEAKDQEDLIEYQKLLYKAQHASLADIQDLADTAASKRDEKLAAAEDLYLTERFGLINKGASSEQIAALDEQFENKKRGYQSEYENILLTLWDSNIRESDLSDVYSYASEIAGDYLTGQIGPFDAVSAISDKFGLNVYGGDMVAPWYSSDRQDLGKILAQELFSLGGYDSVKAQMDYHLSNAENASNPEIAATEREYAEKLRHLLAMVSLVNNFYLNSPVEGDDLLGIGVESSAMKAGFQADINAYPEFEREHTFSVVANDLQIESVTKSAQDYLDNNPGTWQVNVGYSVPEIPAPLKHDEWSAPEIPALPKYGEGGRATEPSIFGEAGAEWAIPEEHSWRTAALLDATRKASGFTWPELLERNGGLNGNASNIPTTIIYSPTVYANDASGVEAVLSEDKKKLDKWWRDKKMKEEVATYG